MRSPLALTLLLLPLAAAVAADPPTEPRKYLDWWYEQLGRRGDGRVSPREIGAWDRPFKQLESQKPEEREAAVTFLRDVAALSVADDAAGKAPPVSRFEVHEVTPDSDRGCTLALTWRALTLHYFGGGGDNRPEQFPLLAWYLESETEVKLQGKAAGFLDSYTTADADKLRLKLAAGGHPNAEVVALALKQVAGHKQKVPADELLALCQHHRKPVREAARELNKTQGGKDPGPFDPAKAMQSPPMKALLAELQQWTPDVLPAKDSELVEVRLRYIDDNKREQKQETYLGWLVEKKGGTVKLLLPGSHTHTFTHGERGSLHVYATSDTPVTREVSTAPGDVKTLVDAMAEERKEAARDAEQNPGRTLAELAFGPPGLSRAEVFAGVWLVRAGHTAEAAEVLLPALDAHDTDRYLLDFARREVGEIVGARMELAFADRDYAEALKIARRIDAVYRDTEYHPQAVRFLAELPKRKDDFKTFTLPTPEEWKALKAKLSHDERVDYLASRLRLIRMTPGYETRVVPREAQFADAGRKRPLVNPYGELVGGGPVWFRADIPAVEGMKLTVKDIPALAKHLKDDWLTLCAGYTRFDQSRTTRGLLRGIINHLADHQLCAVEFDGLTPKEVDAEIERLTKWAKAHETLSEIDLQWELYQKALKEDLGAFEDGVYGRVERRMDRLLGDKALSKERRADILAAMKGRYERKDAGWERARILELYLAHDPKAGLKFAEAELGRKGSALVLAARIVFEAGDKAKARAALGGYLATDKLDGGYWVDAMDFLLKDDAKESRAEAVKLFENPRLAQADNLRRLEILRLCLKAGMAEPYRFYRARLDDAKEAEYFAGEMVRGPVGKGIAPDDPGIKRIAADHPKAADQIPHLKEWLDAKLAKKKE